MEEKEIQRLINKVKKAQPTIEQVQKFTCQVFGVAFEDILSRTRKREITEARHIAQFIVRETYNIPLKRMGDLFCKDHSSVIHGLKTAKQLLEYDDLLIRKFKEIVKKIDAFNKRDTIVSSVVNDLNQRSAIGIEKYNTTLDRKDLHLRDWLIHQYEELLDAALYCKRAIKEIDNKQII